MDEALSVLTAIGTLVAIGSTLVLLAQGQRDRRALAENEIRLQASKVSCWADWFTPEFATFAQPQLPAVLVRNTSDAAVYDAFVDYRAPSDGSVVRESIGPVAPGDQRRLEVEYAGPLDGPWQPAAMLPRLYFQDAAGRRWVRDGIGRLQVDPGPADDL